MRRPVVVLALLLLPTSPALARQDSHQHDASSPGWQWSVEATAFGGYNYQYRKFRDFDEIESQNWLMTTLSKAIGGTSHLRIDGMFSLEPFTLRDIGSPQVFQTGETFDGAPLIDYQHPHDLVMNLGAEYSRSFGSTTVSLQGYVVGPAPIGPPIFMHRLSATENLQAPLSHHNLDATHITPGVVAAGLEWNGFKIEAGAFHGREPDENRLDFDVAKLDSYGGRLSWADGPWHFQFSAADLTTPERKSPYDATRVTASASYFRGDENRSIAWLAAFGQNREVFGNLEAMLFEITRRFAKHAIFARAEAVAKDILDAGFHPIGVAHTHRQSQVSALTVGYMRDVASERWGKVGIGGDVTGYLTPRNLSEAYGSPVSFHVYLRYRGVFPESAQGLRPHHGR
jgi:hypothetical protein